MAENVKVAVRVRPFNEREKQRNATLVINMTGNTTYIKNPENMSAEPKRFAFDFSYWSHDEFKDRGDGYLEPSSSKYADQQRVFDDLGKGILENAWKGYNCSLFAYGQTGSGKSYSVMGYGNNKGIVPMFCDELFKEVEAKRSSAGKDEEYQVTFSMLEIYNEQVRDLLNTKSLSVKGGLKVRQNPSKGFYVESLISSPVNSFKEIENKINEGNRNRTVAATNMNATSSRAHTIVAITFVQKTPNETGQNMTRTSSVNLVDLAGSERADSTGATGDRLKEGSAINQSLSSLGNVISALAEQSTGKKKVMVPYRDSVLTKLLQNALGGNSKTIMIAALSPADINYDETVSTLRFADRAKAIKTTATVNESPTDKLIRELREENARLMEMIKTGGISVVATGGSNSDEIEEMKRQLEAELKANQEEMENMKKSWEQRMQEREIENKTKFAEESQIEADRKVIPHFWNLNEDPVLTAMVIHFAKPGVSKVGNRKAQPPPEILINGLSINSQHAVVTNKDNKVKLKPGDGVKILVNGMKLTKETELHHNDRVLFGPNHMYVFHHPQDEAKMVKEGKPTETPTFDSAQQEIAQKSGFMNKEGKSEEDIILQEDVIQMLPMVNEADAMSAELDKKVKFELALVSPQARGLDVGKTEVMVKMKNLVNGNEWLWDRNKFINRKFLMQEMYQNYVEGADDWDVPQDRDPFWEPADSEILIGTVFLHLMSLAHKLDAEETLTITNYQGKEQGHVDINIIPVEKSGEPLGEDDFVDEPKDLIGTNLNFKLKINFARGLPSNIAKSCCKFKFYLDEKYSTTDEVEGMNPEYNFSKLFTFDKVTDQFSDYLSEKSVVIEVWGKQKGEGMKSGGTVSTKQMMQKEKTNLGPFLNTPTNQPGGHGVLLTPGAQPSSNKGGNQQKPNNNIAVPVPTPQQQNDNKEMANQVNMYKKRADEAENKAAAAEKKAANASKTLSDVENLLKQKKAGGATSITIEELQALLNDPNSVRNENLSGASKACSIQ